MIATESGDIDAVFETDGPSGRRVTRFNGMGEMVTPRFPTYVAPDDRIEDLGIDAAGFPEFVASRALGTRDAVMVVGGRGTTPWTRQLPSEPIFDLRIHSESGVVTFRRQNLLTAVPCTWQLGERTWEGLIDDCSNDSVLSYALTGNDRDFYSVSACDGAFMVRRFSDRNFDLRAERRFRLGNSPRAIVDIALDGSELHSRSRRNSPHAHFGDVPDITRPVLSTFPMKSHFV